MTPDPRPDFTMTPEALDAIAAGLAAWIDDDIEAALAAQEMEELP